MLVGLLPMKGHSERVPGKNLRPIAGRPLFAWITSSMLNVDAIDRVVVDTDSDAIESAVNREFGEAVEIVRRPTELEGDFVAMHDIVANLCRTLEGDHFLQTHSTNPLLRSETLDAAIAAYHNDTVHDSLMSVTPWHSRFYTRDGRPVNHDPANLMRTQDLPPLLEENSNIYIASRAVIEATGRRIGQNPLLFEMDPTEAIDIDVEHDFSLAEHLLETRNG